MTQLAVRPGQRTPFYAGPAGATQTFNPSGMPSPVAILRPLAANPTAAGTLPYFHPISRTWAPHHPRHLCALLRPGCPALPPVAPDRLAGSPGQFAWPNRLGCIA